MDLELKWAKEKLLERDKQLSKLVEENSKLREGLREEISLRDHFAGLAMQVIQSKSHNIYHITREAYWLADAMLEARDKVEEDE
jgi:hypothetical protein